MNKSWVNRLNRWSDRDWMWFPYLRLRPKRNEIFTLARLAALSLALMPISYSCFLSVVLIDTTIDPSVRLKLAGVLTVIFLLVNGVLGAFSLHAWNVRARLERDAIDASARQLSQNEFRSKEEGKKALILTIVASILLCVGLLALNFYIGSSRIWILAASRAASYNESDRRPVTGGFKKATYYLER